MHLFHRVFALTSQKGKMKWSLQEFSTKSTEHSGIHHVITSWKRWLHDEISAWSGGADISARLLKQILYKWNWRLQGKGFSPGWKYRKPSSKFLTWANCLKKPTKSEMNLSLNSRVNLSVRSNCVCNETRCEFHVWQLGLYFNTNWNSSVIATKVPYRSEILYVATPLHEV